MEPMVTLHHFTNPLWFIRKGGWAASGSARAFLPFVHRVVVELGALVSLRCTLNEPTIYAAHGWIPGESPPARLGDLASFYRVLANMRRAHELAYLAIKRRWPDSPVGLSHHKFLFLPASKKRADRLAAQTARLVGDRAPVAPGRLRNVGESTPDFIGIAHCHRQCVAFAARRPRYT